MEPRTSALLTQPSCGTFGQHRLCNLARHTSSMHVLGAEVLADSSKSAFQVGKPSQSPRRHAEIVPDSASRRHRSFRFSHIMRMPCCHVAPLYHVTLLPDLQLPCLKTAYALCTQISSTLWRMHVSQYYCSYVCANSNPVIVIAVEKKKDMENLHCAVRSDRQRSRW